MKVLSLLSLFIFSAFSNTEIEADNMYAQRGDDRSLALQAANIYAALIEDESLPAQDRARLMIKQSRALYFFGLTAQKENKDLRKKVHEQGYEVGKSAVALLKDSQDTNLLAQSLFWQGANLGKWGEAKGALSSLGQWRELRKLMGKLIKTDETAVWYGARRILGRAYYKLPRTYGGHSKSLAELKKAYEGTLNQEGVCVHGKNAWYYAETLIKKKKITEAKKILEQLVQADPETLNPERVPETRMEQEEAQKILDSL